MRQARWAGPVEFSFNDFIAIAVIGHQLDVFDCEQRFKSGSHLILRTHSTPVDEMRNSDLPWRCPDCSLRCFATLCLGVNRPFSYDPPARKDSKVRRTQSRALQFACWSKLQHKTGSSSVTPKPFRLSTNHVGPRANIRNAAAGVLYLVSIKP